jgi:Protein of unknown function (DUF4019)
MRARCLAIILLVLASPAFAMTADEAEHGATSWLGLIDTSKFAESWTEAGALFKSKISQDEWATRLAEVRQPLGTLASRKVTSVKLAQSLPGQPDGDYAIVQFQTSYANKASAIETVTLVMESTKPRVIGYFIR